MFCANMLCYAMMQKNNERTTHDARSMRSFNVPFRVSAPLLFYRQKLIIC